MGPTLSASQKILVHSQRFLHLIKKLIRHLKTLCKLGHPLSSG